MSLHHAGHAAAHRHCRCCCFFGRFVGNDGFGGKNHSGNACCILQGASGNFGRVNDTGFNHVNIFFGKSVEAKAFAAAFNGIYNNCAFKACVVSDLAYRFFDSAFNDFNAGFFVAGCFNAVQCGLYLQKCGAAACNNTFGNCCAGCVKSVFNAQFFIFQFNFGCSANFNYCYAACKFGKAFLKFFSVEFGSGFRNLGTDLCNTCCDFFFAAAAVNDGGEFFGYANLACAAEVFQG